MKNAVFVEYHGEKFDTSLQMNRFKEVWKEAGKLVKDIKDINLYINVEQRRVYYVVNGEINGSFDIVK